MNNIIKIDGVGELSVTENIWTGARTLVINGIKLQKVSKKQFSCVVDGQELNVFFMRKFLDWTQMQH